MFTRKHPITNVGYEYIAKRGHYYWREITTGSIVVSDESANRLNADIGSPWDTEDGILYLDTNALKKFPELSKYKTLLPTCGYSIPLFTQYGEVSYTPANLEEFLFVTSLSKE